MKVGDLVYPFFEESNKTIGLLVGIQYSSVLCSERATILIRGHVYSVPTHQIREIKCK